MRRIVPILLTVFLLFAAAGCNSGLPQQAGNYELVSKSLNYDGKEYSFFWVGKDGQIHSASGDDIKLVQDSKTFLEMRGNEPVIHMAQDDGVKVQARDRQGSFSTFWYPFMLGRMLSPGGSPVIINQPAPGSPSAPPQTPTYHYPPANSFGRDDTLQGSVTNNKAAAPDYGKIQPAPYSVSGKSAGTGGGTAATGKSGALSGQQGGSGAGGAATAKGGSGTSGAATAKGGFQSGASGFKSSAAPSIGAGSGAGKIGSSSAPKSSGGFRGGSVGRSGGRGGGK